MKDYLRFAAWMVGGWFAGMVAAILLILVTQTEGFLIGVMIGGGFSLTGIIVGGLIGLRRMPYAL